VIASDGSAAAPPERTRARYRWTVWVAVFTAFFIVHGLLFCLVHNYVDMRACMGHSPDPLLKLIPFDPRWRMVTIYLYIAFIVVTALAVLTQAARGLHSPALRWALALVFMTSMRMATLMMIPLCGPTVPAGYPAALASPAMLNLGFLSFPWRVFAQNDMVYSGHTSLFVMLLLATRTWAPAARVTVGIFVALMMYALLGEREHYTIDLLLAFPCSFFADTLSVTLLRRAARSA
jgi:hypothetical protein